MCVDLLLHRFIESWMKEHRGESKTDEVAV
jgi:hypothetical protein